MSTSAPSPARRQRAYVPTEALARSVSFDDDMMHVRFTDGRILSVPLIWFPVLHQAAPELRVQVKIHAGGRSLHWPDLDEDLSIAGLMAGVDWQAA